MMLINKIVKFHGIEYLTPNSFEFLTKQIKDYPSFCGAGNGIGDKIVPERIGGMRVAHICHIHDIAWETCKATWWAYLKTNMAFGYNLAVYLSTGGGGLRSTIWRLIKGATYVGAVSTVGWGIFKRLKGVS